MDSCLYSKTISTINITLDNLTSRIDNLESLDYKFWIPTGIAIISVLYSIYQVWFQNSRKLIDCNTDEYTTEPPIA